MNTDLRKDAKNVFEKDFFKLMNNSVFGKTMENIRNHRDIKLVTANAQRRKYVSKPNYMTSKCFSKDLMAIEMRKTDENKEAKKAEGTKKCVIKNDLKFDNYKDSVLKIKIILRSQQRFRSHHHNVFREEINKVAINSNYDKRIQDFDGITTYACGTSATKICESEMLAKLKVKVIAMYC